MSLFGLDIGPQIAGQPSIQLRSPNSVTEQINALDSPLLGERLAALRSLRELELRGRLNCAEQVGPVLPSYDHVHTSVSYGSFVPGVFSVARMVWAAHESQADSILVVEHESLAHLGEARHAVDIVNRGGKCPLRLLLGIEFKAPIATNDDASRQFGEDIRKVWGQSEAAWVVGIGAKPSMKLARLVSQFQDAKRTHAQHRLEKLNRYLGLTPPLTVSDLLTPDGNVTDRLLCFAVAKGNWPDADEQALARHATMVRKMLNPGGPAYAPFPPGLPSYQELIEMLADLGMTPTFTAQLRGQVLAETLPLLKSWGIGGLDVAGIDPSDPHADRDIRQFIALAEQHELALFAGADYRGAGTGWTKRATWMDHPFIRATIDQFHAYPLASATK